ncbi:protein involved in gliding motility GldC [Cyclonatronum proteinivorum]|uniref:Protein involved in gliding motility GldC n=1 Tax=Cyclonatronum proteinivorum TaxID=1457365 RepID=A0A345UNF3_9BACT|nr:gliding motility protein GldC [Cyclonatronum proteinivorum]AXJ02005.1 protein involved in gliding motility GldC [Cyclonatronum proteinivorum]
MKTKNIDIAIELDDKDVPEKITWNALDAGLDKPANCRAMLLSLWDNDNKQTLKLDLWTKNMTVDEMKLFFYETLSTMADTFEKSTKDDRMSGDMRDFCEYFAEKMEIKK